MCEVIVCVWLSECVVVVVCVCVGVVVTEAAGGGGREEAGIQNQKQEPPTKMWGK